VPVIAAIAGVGGSAGYQVAMPPRSDPYTATRAAEDAKRIAAETLNRHVVEHGAMRREWLLDLRESEHRITTKTPPAPLRLRVIALEEQVRALSAEHDRPWVPPTTRFSGTVGQPESYPP
jgi:hypothetical protein